jgi:hypothetical protein
MHLQNSDKGCETQLEPELKPTLTKHQVQAQRTSSCMTQSLSVPACWIRRQHLRCDNSASIRCYLNAAVGGQLHSVFNPIKNYLGVEASNGQAFLEMISPQLQTSISTNGRKRRLKPLTCVPKQFTREWREPTKIAGDYHCNRHTSKSLALKENANSVGKESSNLVHVIATSLPGRTSA